MLSYPLPKRQAFSKRVETSIEIVVSAKPNPLWFLFLRFRCQTANLKIMRRYDLDWLRVLLFGLLVPYHAAIGFVSYGGRVYGYRNQEIAGDWLEKILFFSHNWRLPALFMISGVGSWFLLKHGPKAFFKNRVIRLVIPLIVAMVIWNAPHGYYNLLASGNELGITAFYKMWLSEFWWGHARHLWFLINLFVYGLLLLAVAPYLRRLPNLSLSNFAFGLVISAFILDFMFKPLSFERPLDFRDFWYIPFFLAGYLAMAQSENFWLHLARLRWALLAFGVVTSLIFIPIYNSILPAQAADLANGGWVIKGWPYHRLITVTHGITYSLNAAIWCGIVFGFAYHNLNKPSLLLAHLNRAVYPIFIFHFPVMMAGLYYLRSTSWHWALEMALLSVGTFFISYILHLAFDRSKLTRLMVGLSPDKSSRRK